MTNFMINNIAYLCLEIGLEADMKTYAGGLGILAGDTLKSAADLGIPMIGVTLLYKNGYFKQDIDSKGVQLASPDIWDWENKLKPTNYDFKLELENNDINIKVWKYELGGLQSNVPIYFLDADLDLNNDNIREVSQNLYTSQELTRFYQELILGVGGVKFLELLEKEDTEIKITKYHLNESHAGLAILPLLGSYTKAEVREKIVFTTHTPIVTGHKIYELSFLEKHLGQYFEHIPKELYRENGVNMTELCLEFSGFSNGVSKKHAVVTHEMFDEYKIEHITNGVHHLTWLNPSLTEFFDKNIPDWRLDLSKLRVVSSLFETEIHTAIDKGKARLLNFLNQKYQYEFDTEVFTIGFARRAANYKRASLIFQDKARLDKIAQKYGKLQLIFAGKAYPTDELGKEFIKEIYDISQDFTDSLYVAYIPNYDIELGKILTGGVDLWLNNPVVPQEASGTSGMKASLNGIPSLSTMDGWWLEGAVEGVTGWSVGQGEETEESELKIATDIYDKLENTILPIFYQDKQAWSQIQKNCIAINGSYFNTHRMLQEYVLKAYNL
jgi:glycogen phosphorylase